MMHEFDTDSLRQVGHRPWPMPRTPWLMQQTWTNLLFAHWPVAPPRLARHVPSAFALDLFEGSAWIGIVPFHMSNVGVRGIPWTSRFPELNVRTYVRAGDRPGVHFFSLDAASLLAVGAARSLLNLPYFHATMTIGHEGSAISYASHRMGSSEALRVVYRPEGAPAVPAPGSLEHFLTERYCLYHVGRRGRPYRLEIHHAPWRLQTARAEFEVNAMTDRLALDRLIGVPLLHFAERQDAVAWWPQPIH